MELGYFLWLIRKRFWLLLLACLIGGIAALVVSILQPKMYEAETTLYVASLNQSDYSTVSGAQQAAKSFALLPKSDPVLFAALKATGDRNLSTIQLSSMITVENNVDSQIVVIQVLDHDPNRAVRLVREITQQSVARFEGASTDSGSTRRFIKQEMDTLEVQIQNLQKELAAQTQAGSSTPSPAQTNLVNQLEADLNGKLTLYNQLLNSYQSTSGFQVTLLGDTQPPPNPVGAGLLAAIAIGMLAGLIAIVGVILFIEQKDRIVYPAVKAGQATDLATSIMIKGLPARERRKPTQLASSNVLKTNGAGQNANRSIDVGDDGPSTLHVSKASASLRCPRCHSQVVSQAAFCAHCGYSLDNLPGPAMPAIPSLGFSTNNPPSKKDGE